MTPLERRRYINTLVARHTRDELLAMKQSFETAITVCNSYLNQMTQTLVLDELIESVKMDPSTPIHHANEMSHPAFRHGVISGLSLLCGALERDHTQTALLLAEAYQEKINHG